MKNELELEENWNQTKGKLKRNFPMLTDTDLLLVKGKQEQMLSRIQAKLGKTKQELDNLMSELRFGMI